MLRGMARGGVPRARLPITEADAARVAYALPSVDALYDFLGVAAHLVVARLTARALGPACVRSFTSGEPEVAFGDAFRLVAATASRVADEGGDDVRRVASREDAFVLLDRRVSGAAPTADYPAYVFEDARLAFDPPGVASYAVVTLGGSAGDGEAVAPDPCVPVALVVSGDPVAVPATATEAAHVVVAVEPLSAHPAGEEAALALADGALVAVQSAAGTAKGTALALRHGGAVLALFLATDTAALVDGDTLTPLDHPATRLSPYAADAAVLLALAFLSASQGRVGEARTRWMEAWERVAAGQRVSVPLGADGLRAGDAPPARSPSIYGETADET